MVNHESFQFDLKTHAWVFQHEQDIARIWTNPADDLLVQHFAPVTPTGLPPDYPALTSQITNFEAAVIKPKKGALISFTQVSPKGVEAFMPVWKLRNPERPLAIRYMGAFWFHMEHFFCNIQFVCDEHGTTGIREAVVLNSDRGKQGWEEKWGMQRDAAPKAIASVEDYEAEAAKSMLRRIPSDDEQYDAMFPDHPLSRLRRYLKHFELTMNFDAEVLKAKPFRPVAAGTLFDKKTSSKFEAFLRWLRGDKKQ